MQTQPAQSNILKWVIIALLVIGISVGLYFIFRPKPEELPADGGTPSPGGGGFGEVIANIISGIPIGDFLSGLFAKCDKNRPGYDTNGKPRKKCGASDYTANNCDESKPGFNKNGVLDPSCGGGSGACNPFACDENKPGYNMCGDKGFPCN